MKEGTNRTETAQLIEHWFLQNARDFPWRAEDTPWGRLISEFMAQQTQISRVAERWPAMMKRFPTPKAMAEADEQAVLSLWQGLGYYRRARHLKATAEMIMESFDGEVPSNVGDLLRLPGVGKYTAGAIASIAFGEREGIVDANVHRVFCRLENRSGDSVPSQWTWKIAEEFVSACDSPKVCNEALMEFGAVLCTPKKPECAHCPLRTACKSFEAGTQHEIPTPKQKAKRKEVFHYAVVIEHEHELAFEQRGDDGLWAGMWQVPTVESDTELTIEQVAAQLGIRVPMQYLDTFKHTLSHRSISLSVFTCKSGRDNNYLWFKREALAELPLASVQRKVLAVHYSS